MLVPNNMGLFLHAFMMNKDGYPKLLFVAILFSMFTAASAFTFLLLFGKYGSLVFKSFAINYIIGGMIMETFSKTQSTGSIVASFPAAAGIFKKYRIDFCCGGDRSLEEAVEPETATIVLKELEDAFAESKNSSVTKRDLSSLSKIELIEHIESTHHTYMKTALPELGEYIAKILRAHGIDHRELFTVHKLYSNLRTEIEQHLGNSPPIIEAEA